MDEVITILSSFFTNEFLNKIIPPKESTIDAFISRYRDEVNVYIDAISVFPNGENTVYNGILTNIMNYAKKYKISFAHLQIMEFAKKLCTESIYNSMSDEKKYALFKQYIVKCVKSFQVVVIAKSAQFCELIYGGVVLDSTKKKIIELQNETRLQFINILKREQYDSHARASLIEQGKSITEINIVNAENKVLSEHRELMEELRFENQRLRDELQRVKEENIQLMMKPVQNEVVENENFSSDDDS